MKNIQKKLAFISEYGIMIKTYALAQLAVKWEVAETRISVAVSGSGFPMEQVYTTDYRRKEFIKTWQMQNLKFV